MKIAFVIAVMAVTLISTASFAEEEVDFSKIEGALWQRMRDEGRSTAEFHMTMGFTYAEFGEDERAIDHLKEAVALDPGLFMVWYRLALFYMGEPQGEEYFKKAIEANPSYAPPYYWLAYNYCRNGHDEQARVFFESYLQVAQGPEESARISTARKALDELRSGVEGAALRKIRLKDRNI